MRFPRTLHVLALLGVAATLHLPWFARDRRAARWDEIRFERSVREVIANLKDSPRSVTHALVDVRGPYPPLLPICAALHGSLFGQSFAVRRTLGSLLAAITALVTYFGVRGFAGANSSFMSALLTLLAPFPCNYAHVLAAENLLTLLVTISWLITALGKPRSVAWTIGLGITIGLGCLTKWTYPLYICGPMCMRLLQRASRPSAFVALGIGAVVASPWYLRQALTVTRHLWEGALVGEDSWVSSQRGLMGLAFYPKELVRAGVGLPGTIGLVLAVVTLIGAARTTSFYGRRGLAVLAILPPLLVFSVLPTKQLRHLLPLFPILAIVGSVGWSTMRRSWLRSTGGTLILLHIAASAILVIWIPVPPSLSVGGRSFPWFTDSRPPSAPDSTRWPLEEIVECVERRSSEGSVVVVSARTPITASDLEHVDRRRPLGRWIGLPHWFSSGHPLARPLDLAPLRDARLWLVRGAPYADRYPGDTRDLAHWSATLSEEIAQSGGLFATALRRCDAIQLPDGAELALFVVEDPAALRVALGRYVQRWQPDHPYAATWADSASGDFEDARALRSSTGSKLIEPTLREFPLRDDLLWDVPIGVSSDLDHHRELLRATRYADDPCVHLLRLARRLEENPAARWTCLRRAVEANRRIIPQVAEFLAASPPVDHVTLLDALRIEEARLRAIDRRSSSPTVRPR